VGFAVPGRASLSSTIDEQLIWIKPGRRAIAATVRGFAR
jgi:hypothetical protein